MATLEIVNPEIIFVDPSLAHPDPLEAVRRVHRSAPEVPLIVLADGSDKNCATQSLSQGALDYLLKGFIDTRTDLLRDSFTGLYIRDGFLTLGKRAIETAKRRKSTLVLLRMRIDNLAALRAGHGPIAVESSLREVAALPAGGFRATDIIARLGESQFAALAVDAAALTELRETGRDIPFLLVTGTRGEEAAVECIKQGATDYILKDRPTTLGRVVREISNQVKKRKASG